MFIVKKLIKSWWRGLVSDPFSVENGPQIVVIGGGTGLATLLRGIKKYSSNITAIVTMSDDGASTGKLREELGVLPPGDIRKCIAALADEEPLLSKLFDYRFKNGKGLTGHSFGNLFLAALEDLSGSFERAVLEASKILAISGRVMPSTTDDVVLGAELEDGTVVWGESKISSLAHKNPIKKVMLQPSRVLPYKPAIEAIQDADLVIIGPGSLYTSIVPNFLIPEISEAVWKTRAEKVFTCNISTERGETEGFGVEEHLSELMKYTKGKSFSLVLVNSKIIKKEQEGRLGKIKNITTTKRKIGKCKIIRGDIVNEENPLHHDSEKLAKALINIIQDKFNEKR